MCSRRGFTPGRARRRRSPSPRQCGGSSESAVDLAPPRRTPPECGCRVPAPLLVIHPALLAIPTHDAETVRIPHDSDHAPATVPLVPMDLGLTTAAGVVSTGRIVPTRGRRPHRSSPGDHASGRPVMVPAALAGLGKLRVVLKLRQDLAEELRELLSQILPQLRPID